MKIILLVLIFGLISVNASFYNLQQTIEEIYPVGYTDGETVAIDRVNQQYVAISLKTSFPAVNSENIVIYKRNGTYWNKTQTILSPFAGLSLYGKTIQVNGNYMMVGAEDAILSRGRIVVYKLNTSDIWVQHQIILNVYFTLGFGKDIAMSSAGNMAVVNGAYIEYFSLNVTSDLWEINKALDSIGGAVIKVDISDDGSAILIEKKLSGISNITLYNQTAPLPINLTVSNLQSFSILENDKLVYSANDFLNIMQYTDLGWILLQQFGPGVNGSKIDTSSDGLSIIVLTYSERIVYRRNSILQNFTLDATYSGFQQIAIADNWFASTNQTSNQINFYLGQLVYGM